ncbi:MAG TPA: AMP-binding protein, partial [Marmoricola sp.]|nr:AMP-binding protein [Marmoricola sp.]
MQTAPAPVFPDDRLNYWAQTAPDTECMTYLDRTWTFGEWQDRIRRAAGALRTAGITRGDVIAFLDKNHPACVELTIAAAMLGAATAIINFRLAGDEIDYAINDSGAKLLVVGSELMPTITAIREKLSGVQTIWEVTPDGAEGDEYEQQLAAAEPIDRDPAVSPDDVALVMYSSGTTGRPKGVMITQYALIKHTINAHDGWEFEPGDKNMVAMPLFHVGGTSYVQFGIHDGIPSVMTRDPDGASLAGAILQGANRTF